MIKVLSAFSTASVPVLGFSATGAGLHSEGLIVDFHGQWAGNFIRGVTSYDAVHEEHGPDVAYVISGGSCYVVDVYSKSVLATFGGGITCSAFCAIHDQLLLADDTHIAAYRKTSCLWNSERISWDGFRLLSLGPKALSGEAYDPIENCWAPFELDLGTGAHRGGSYRDGYSA